MITKLESYKKLLARHPHIAQNLELFWGKPGFQEILNSYFIDTRGDTRIGFQLDVVELLLDILDQHDIHHPHLKVATTFNGIEIDSTRYK